MEQEYPGQVDASSIYLVNAQNKLLMAYNATVQAGKSTPINMTNHGYWNLSGDFKDPTIASHTFQTPNSSKTLVTDAELIPTGEFAAVEGTPLDFTGAVSTSFGDLDRLTGAIHTSGKPGIDHAYVLEREGGVNAKNFIEACSFRHEGSGREMKIWTTQAALVCYTGNYLPEDGSDGNHRQHATICLETVNLNDAMNHIG